MCRCLDCGFCGFYINFGGGPKWEEMPAELRRAFEEGEERNPLGQVVGTGHWNYVHCLENREEWKSWPSPDKVSREQLQETLVKNRKCQGYFEYHAGFSPPQHDGIQRQQTGLHLGQWNTRIALLALIVATVSLIVTLVRC